mgnify:FL=1
MKKYIIIICVTFLIMSCNTDKEIIVDTSDPYIWLEEVEGTDALDWVRSQNKITEARYAESEEFSSTYKELLEEYQSTDRIPYASVQGGKMYNFWRDEKNVRGVWRRTTIESYKTENPEWETLLDIDELAKKENQNWVYKGSDCLAPNYDRCLLSLSIGGKDAVVVREFDLVNKVFVEDGFNTVESKQYSSWINENQIMIATDFGEGTMNESGYPKQVKLWTRGENLYEIAPIFDGDYTKIFSFPFSSIRPDGNYFGIVEGPTFFTKVLYLLKDEELVKLDLPLKMDVSGTFKGSLIVSLDEDWRGYSSGSLVAVNIEDALNQEISDASIELIFAPTEKRFMQGVRLGKNEIYVNVLDNINGKILHYEKIGPNWSESEIRSFGNAALSISSIDEWDEHLFISAESFTEPTSLYYSDANKDFIKIKSLKEKFDPDKYRVEQLYATSADGTQIPYFQVSNVSMEKNSSNPTLLYGYGGFQISLTPSYLGSFARQWLDNGGVYVIANIRGGGEFGPKWHQSALKQNRQRAYDDFIAVGEALIANEITSSKHLGIRGGSNGGLLVGAVVTQRPDLFNAVICAVPLLDMYRYDKLLAGASWVDEYGDPDNPDEWSFISKYSPYQNVFAEREYPEIYFYTSTKDDRVHPGHARKMAKKMIDQGHQVIYYENIEGGHSAAANLKQSAYMTTLQLEYLKDKLL